MYLTHTIGGSLVKPLFFDFPLDHQTFSDDVISSTYMLGGALKVPVVQLGGDFEHGGRMKTFWCQYLKIGNSIVD